HAALDALLFRHWSMFRGIRMPIRWAMRAKVGLALLAGLGAAFLVRGRGRIARTAIVAAIAAVMLLELRVAPLRWYLVPLQRRPIYAWIASLPLRGAVLELPMTQASDRKSTRLNSSHVAISYAVFCLKKKSHSYFAD